MRYALLIYSAPRSSENAAPAKGVMTDWIAYTRALKDSGSLLAAEQLTATDSATSVRVRGDDRLLTDGPFMETKEHLLGFFLVEVPDLDTALKWAATMPTAAHGTVEVRAVQMGGAWRAELGQ
ncbi:MAG TPA: YciI family protein [Streptosporangiaceae bacterium]|nr:YciI family protein [Streptosporangiaceae bacterium]